MKIPLLILNRMSLRVSVAKQNKISIIILLLLYYAAI